MANISSIVIVLLVISGAIAKKYHADPTNADLLKDLARRLTGQDIEEFGQLVPVASATGLRIEEAIDSLQENIEKSPKATQRLIRFLLGLLYYTLGLGDAASVGPGPTLPKATGGHIVHESPLHRDPNEETQQNHFQDDDKNEFPPEPEEDLHLGPLDIEPGISKAQIEYFQREVLPNIISDDIQGTLRERLGKHLAYFIPLCVTIAEKIDTLPKGVQKALLLPLQYLPGGRRYSAVNHGNARGMIIDLSRPKREIISPITDRKLSRKRRETEQEKVDRLLGLSENSRTEQSDKNETLSSQIVTYLQGLAKALLPFEKFFLIFPKYFFRIIAIPFTIYFALPSIRAESAEWYIQPLPIRIVQALMPLFTRGDWNVLFFLKALIPLPLRLVLAFIPFATGPYKFPKKFVGLIPSKGLPHLRIRLPDGDYKRIEHVIPYLLQIPPIQLPQYVYDNIMRRLPPKLKHLQKNLGIPTIVMKPWQILGIFPRFFPEGPSNNAIKTALLLVRIGPPLVFITFFLNPFNVPGAILLGLLFTLPAIATFNPLRWLNPIILIKLALGIKPVLPIF